MCWQTLHPGSQPYFCEQSSTQTHFEGWEPSVLTERGWSQVCDPCDPRRAHLAQVIKVVFVMHPAVVGSHAVRSVGDVSGIHSQTVIELAFEKLWERRERQYSGRRRHNQRREAQGKGGTVRGGKLQELVHTTRPLFCRPRLGLPFSLGSAKATQVPRLVRSSGLQ